MMGPEAGAAQSNTICINPFSFVFRSYNTTVGRIDYWWLLRYGTAVLYFIALSCSRSHLFGLVAVSPFLCRRAVVRLVAPPTPPPPFSPCVFLSMLQSKRSLYSPFDTNHFFLGFGILRLAVSCLFLQFFFVFFFSIFLPWDRTPV